MTSSRVDFTQRLQKCAQDWVDNLPKQVVIISHPDGDGICATALLMRILDQLNVGYSSKFIVRLGTDTIDLVKNTESEGIILVDCGSSQIDMLTELAKTKHITILDHHIPHADRQQKNLNHINPFLFDKESSSRLVSAAGVVYLFGAELELLTKKDMVKECEHIPIIGAISDSHEKNGFIGYNKEILELAIVHNLIHVEKTIHLFGIETKPLHKMLKFSADLFIPGVTNNMSEVIKLMSACNIRFDQKHPPFYNNLNDRQLDALSQAIRERRKNLENTDDIYCMHYVMADMPERTPLRDAREFATVINACGKLEQPDIGIGALLGQQEMLDKAIDIQQEYKHQIGRALSWIKGAEGKEATQQIDQHMLIDAGDNIPADIAGTMCSIITKSDTTKEGTIVCCTADADELTTKISIRIAGHSKNNPDLQKLLLEIVEKLDGEGGGHKAAAGGLIPTKNKPTFLEEMKKALLNQ